MKQVFSNGNLQTNQTQINFNYAPYQSDFFSKNTPLNCETIKCFRETEHYVYEFLKYQTMIQAFTMGNTYEIP